MKETAYVLQAALITSWWLGLAIDHRFFMAFQFNGISAIAFWAFCIPDLFVIAALSLLRAYQPWQFIEWIVLGGFAYGALYCVNATVLTGSGYLPSSLMIVGLFYNLFLCFQDHAFRTSTQTGPWVNALKTLVQTVCMWVIFLLVFPSILLAAFDAWHLPSRGATVGIGIALFLLFSSLGLSSAYFMVRYGDGTPLPLDQTNRLVTRGPYRILRNPMAVAGIGQGIAIAILFWSLPILVYSILGGIVWHLAVRPFEERDMQRRFGSAYVEYRKQVRCWIPTFRYKP